MVLFMGFGCVLLHITLRFAAFSLAFWCILHCVLVHIAMCFGTYYDAFCCKMRCNN